MSGMPTTMMMGEIAIMLKGRDDLVIPPDPVVFPVDAALPLPNGLLIKHRSGEMQFFADHCFTSWKFTSQAILSERAKRN